MRIVVAALFAFAAFTAGAAAPGKGPVWASLTADQQQVLAPLAGDWNRLAREQKVKWLGIAKRYPGMKPEEQKRIQTRMQKWAKLTPEQRWQARAQYRSIGTLAPDRRDELRKYWAQYQALPPHEKRVFDVPPSYVRPAERRAHAPRKSPPPTPAHAFPSPL